MLKNENTLKHYGFVLDFWFLICAGCGFGSVMAHLFERFTHFMSASAESCKTNWTQLESLCSQVFVFGEQPYHCHSAGTSLSSFAFCRIRLSSCLSDICNFGGWLKRILNILLGFLSMLRQGSRSLGAGHPSHIRWSRKFMLVWCCSSCCILVQMLQALTARLWWYRMLGYRGCRLVIDLAWSCCVCFRATQGRYGDNWMYSFRKDLAKSRKQWLVGQNLKKGHSSVF